MALVIVERARRNANLLDAGVSNLGADVIDALNLEIGATWRRLQERRRDSSDGSACLTYSQESDMDLKGSRTEQNLKDAFAVAPAARGAAP
jgi:hypothetical protein